MYASSALEARPADGEGLIDNELLPAPQPLPCLITIDGTEIEARTGDSILAAARAGRDFDPVDVRRSAHQAHRRLRNVCGGGGGTKRAC